MKYGIIKRCIAIVHLATLMPSVCACAAKWGFIEKTILNNHIIFETTLNNPDGTFSFVTATLSVVSNKKTCVKSTLCGRYAEHTRLPDTVFCEIGKMYIQQETKRVYYEQELQQQYAQELIALQTKK